VSKLEVEEPPRPPRGLLLGLAVVGIVVAAAIAGIFALRLQPPLAGSSVAPDTVIMPVGVGANTGLSFTPQTVTVVIGVNSSLTFINKDSVVHTVTATDKSFNSGDIQPGQSYTYNFTSPGTFTYYCVYHSWMKGTVKVVSR
jgi:plastocyanin